jgi:HK97 gp10 family phage protein
MSDIALKVSGLDELKRRLEALDDGKLARSMRRTASRKAAKVLMATQQQTVPVEEGDLRDSIGIQVKTEGQQTLIGPDERLNFIGRFHEFGTKHMAGIHWMQKAFDSASGEALDAYVAEAQRLLDKKQFSDLMAAIEEGLSKEDDE